MVGVFGCDDPFFTAIDLGLGGRAKPLEPFAVGEPDFLRDVLASAY